MSRSSTISSKKQDQVRFSQDRVTTVEKFYGLFCDTLGSVIRKSARLRDKGDLFAQHLKAYAEIEQINTSTKLNLVTFAQNFSAVQDYRNAEVQRLEEKVLKPLILYGKICKNIKGSVRKSQNATKREDKQLEKLEKLQQKVPQANSADIAKAQLDLQKIRQDGGNSKEQLISEMDKFEKDKLTDLKSILSEYVKIEMMFHARALKYLSECYQAAQRIDTDADMDLFRARLLDVTGLTPNQTMTSIPSLGQSQTPYGFNYALFSTSTSQPTYLPQRPGVQGVDDEEDEDDDDDDDDDDDFDVTDDDDDDLDS
ncbi:protein FAM92A1 [Biomphalaria glabrata]|nr:protein FAM92A1-like [Biomphalaria glabrata]